MGLFSRSRLLRPRSAAMIIRPAYQDQQSPQDSTCHSIHDDPTLTDCSQPLTPSPTVASLNLTAPRPDHRDDTRLVGLGDWAHEAPASAAQRTWATYHDPYAQR